MIRVLHVVPALNAAGIESFIMNIYRNIDRRQVQFDFYVTRNQSEYYESEIRYLGGHIYKSNKSVFRLFVFLKQNSYNIIHIHATTPIQNIYCFIAYFLRIKCRILHSHSAFVPGKNIIKYFIYILFKVFSFFATNYFACSREAAYWLFPKRLANKISIIPNGIDTHKYMFKEQYRNELRKEYNLNNNIVLLQVGRFTDQKNQLFSLELFKQIHSINKKYKLVYVGEGTEKQSIQNIAKKYNLSSSILFLGTRNDVNKILCMSDIYLMPSKYEGLPVAAVEAECSGIFCILSDQISREILLSENVSILPLDKEKWAKCIQSFAEIENRDKYAKKIYDKGFDVAKNASKLQQFYLRAL